MSLPACAARLRCGKRLMMALPIISTFLFLVDASSVQASALRVRAFFNHKGSFDRYDYPDWMEHLNDSTPVNELSLPGTHDTVSLNGGWPTKCQGVGDVELQMRAGLRVFDLRCKFNLDRLPIYHGSYFQDAYLGAGNQNILAKSEAFLAAHPSEFLLMRIVYYGDNHNSHGSFASRIADLSRQFTNATGSESIFWNAANYETMPTVDDVRGKIMILQDKFEPLYKSGPHPRSIVAADLLDDATPELLVINSLADGSISVLQNSGFGTFIDATKEAPIMAIPNVGSYPTCMIAADLDHDGDSDLVVGNEGSPILVLWNQISRPERTLSFDRLEISNTSGAHALCVADLDDNGSLDLVFTHDQGVGLLKNDNGSFTLSHVTGLTSIPRDVAVIDYDHDGDFDLATTISNGVQLIENQSDGAGPLFVVGSFIATPPHPAKLCSMNLDRDDYPDLAVLHYSERDCSNVPNLHPNDETRVAFLKNSGAAVGQPQFVVQDDLLLAAYGDYTGSNFPCLFPPALTCADIDGDGDDDAVVSESTLWMQELMNYYFPTSKAKVYVCENTGGTLHLNATLDEAPPALMTSLDPQDVCEYHLASGVTLADVDHDGSPELAAVLGRDALMVYENESDCAFVKAGFGPTWDRFEIQDNYFMWFTNESYNHKFDSIVAHINRAQMEAQSSGKLFINFTSGSSRVNPVDVAWTAPGLKHGINQRVYNHLAGLECQRPVGVIMMDFPGTGLIERILRLNFPGCEVGPIPSGPVAEANGPYEAQEGSEFVLSAEGSHDPDGAPIECRWILGRLIPTNGDEIDSLRTPTTFETLWQSEWSDSVTASHVLFDDDSCSAVVEVRSEALPYTSDDWASLTVTNVAPTVTISSVVTPVAGYLVPLQGLDVHGSFTDPGCFDTHTAEWAFGDGAVVPGSVVEEHDPPDATGTVSESHVYDAPGSYALVLSIQDDDGGSGQDTVVVKVFTPAEALDFLDEFLHDLPAACFRGQAPQRQNALSQKLAAVKQLLATGDVLTAVEKLTDDIRAKSDGWIDGYPNNDWVIEEQAQGKLCSMLDALNLYLLSPEYEASAAALARFTESRSIPRTYGLSQNQPNPFNPLTTISFRLPKASAYRLVIYSIDGRIVRQYAAFAGPGEIAIVWDGNDDAGVSVSSGIYFYRMETTDFTDTRKMVLIR